VLICAPSSSQQVGKPSPRADQKRYESATADPADLLSGRPPPGHKIPDADLLEGL
jgi:hypothetical protein